jgi:uncharacterized lipoprotein YmbA
MIRRFLPLVFCLATACGFFSNKPNEYYSLEPISGTAVADVSGLPIGIDGVELPPGIDRRGIVVRQEDQSLDIRERQLWAGPLEEMVLHTLSFDLANRLPEGMVVLPGSPRPTGAMRSLHVVFEDLAAHDNGRFVLDGRWVLDGAVHHERIVVPMSSDDSDAIAAAMSQALAELAERVVRAFIPSEARDQRTHHERFQPGRSPPWIPRFARDELRALGMN